MILNFLRFFTRPKTPDTVKKMEAVPEPVAPPPMPYPIFLNSLPKSGTHLLSKAIMGIPHIAHSGYHLERKAIARFVDPDVDFPCEGREDINIPEDLPWIERLLKVILPGQYITSHMFYTQAMHNLLKNMNFKIIVMMRDPRDVVLSWANFMKTEEAHLLFPFFNQKDLNFRITAGIKGVSSRETGTRRQPSIAEIIRKQLNWLIFADAFLVRFEDLIGEKGGGSKENQSHLLTNLLEFFEISCDEKIIDSICENLFGGTYTFNKGIIGSWRNEFTEEHKLQFKEEAGDYLIELGYEKDLDW